MLQRLPDLLLADMVGIDGERHELIQRHAILGTDVEQLGRHRGKAQPLPHRRDRDEERRRDLLLGLALLAQREKRAELVEGMQRGALDVFREAVFLGEPVSPHHARDGGGAGEPLLLDQQFERPEAAAAGRDLEHPVSPPLSSRIGRTVRLSGSVRRAISSASSSIETPALMRRTLAWLSTSRLNGMSRERESAIFAMDFGMNGLRDGPAGTCLGLLEPVMTTPSVLFLSDRFRQTGHGSSPKRRRYLGAG